ncbi:DUF6853 family protein [Neisseria montereyensis]|uniref:Uncharacterized protein n=1 Tax=Neisseria montereyensis TaxID=2973938 RepID=A0ABT2FAY5_9NEIS|nr:hypothetical protein [Neisseria montereyensis]MCS4533282.1 hypothetical protein [Neisseria montereyensis]
MMMEINDLNSVKEALIELGLKEGLDLCDENINENFTSEDSIFSQWFRDYSEDWNDEQQTRIRYLLKHMRKYQNAMDREDTQSARRSLLLAMIWIGTIKNAFSYLEWDMIKLLENKNKTTDFQWTQF